jgi:hypothetical protein
LSLRASPTTQKSQLGGSQVDLVDESPLQPPDYRSEAQKNPAAHISLYEKFRKVADYILPPGEMSKPVLWHCDLRPENIFVQNDRITSVIGWQHAWVGPLFLQARNPPLVAYNGENMLRLPEYYETLDEERDREEIERLEDQVDRSIILHYYESNIQAASPLMKEIMHLPQAQNRRDLVAFSSNTWDGDILPFRQCLIEVARYVDPTISRHSRASI